MVQKAKKATDFTVIPAPENNCVGCWFAGKQVNRLPMCWANIADNLVKQVFANNSGSCRGVIAVLADEVNLKKKQHKNMTALLFIILMIGAVKRWNRPTSDLAVILLITAFIIMAVFDWYMIIKGIKTL